MTDTPEASAPMAVDTALVRQLADLLDATRLTEIEVQDGERRIRVTRAPAAVIAAASSAPPPATNAVPGTAAPPVAEPGADDGDTVRSPMVGTVYLAPEPGARPFVAVGATVKAGDTLLIIEAMKVMNPIVAPAAGTIVRVLVGSGQPVEFDQPLIVVA